MIAAALCIALGQIEFEQVEIPGLYVTQYTFDTELEGGNFVHADVDQDGNVDLVLPNRAYVQKNGILNPDSSVSMPEIESQSHGDLWNGMLYLLSESALSVYQFRTDAWVKTFTLEHKWKLDEPFRFEPENDRPLIVFERFLYDVDSDGQPEIVRPDEPGLAIHTLKDGQIGTSHLDIYPAARPSRFIGYDTLWPSAERRLVLPTHRSLYDILFDEKTATVLERIRHRGGVFSFSIKRYEIEPSTEGKYRAVLLSERETKQLPNHVMQAVSLNDDETFDFIGHRNERPGLKNWKPTLQYFVSTDGGDTFQTGVTRSLSSAPLFIDIDGDGDRDIVADESGLVSGGLTTTVNRALSRTTISHTIRARSQNGKGQFDENWRNLGQFNIKLDAPPRNLTRRFKQYRLGDLVDCTGDFNADGRIDALVSDRPGQASVFLGNADGFEKAAAATISIPLDTAPVAIDIDGDNLDDIIARWGDNYKPRGIYLNKGSAP